MAHIHCNLDTVAVLERMEEAICIPGRMDTPGEVENRPLAAYSLLQGRSSELEDNSQPAAGRQDSAGMVGKQAGSEALLKDGKPALPIRARDKQFVDQQVAPLDRHCLDEEACRSAYRIPPVF